jgi:ferrous iron transport protein B
LANPARSSAACCHTSGDQVLPDSAPIILVGNPNVGKSVVFGSLTGRYVTVSNYPGTTIEITSGALPDGTPVIDTPGVNSLFSISDDERVTTQLLLENFHQARAIVQVADAKNLQRALLLTEQLALFDAPMVLAVNMMDEAEDLGLTIDFDLLSRRLGVSVVPLTAVRGIGLDDLTEAVRNPRHLALNERFDAPVEQAIEDVGAMLPETTIGKRGLAVHLLAGNPRLADRFSLNGSLSHIERATAEQFQRPMRAVLTAEQMSQARSLLDGVVTLRRSSSRHWPYILSDLTTHPIWGIPILLAVLFVVYKIVGEFGAGTVVNFTEKIVFHQWINPFATRIVDAVIPIPLVHDLLVGDYGLITMALSYGLALVLPIVVTFFFVFAILEDSGYLPRLASMLNQVFRLMGLNGKAVLPMILGLGCDTMATVSTRILETRRERILVTLLLALGVPCSAQLGVILGMVGIVSGTAVAIWGGVVVLTMLVVGLLASKVLPGTRSDFILELPPLRLPQLSNVLIKTLARVEWYLKEVLPLFIVGTLILFVVDRTGLLTWLQQAASPLIVNLLGLPAAATGAFLIGFLRRDYGAAGLFAMALAGQLTPTQTVVSMVVITLFIPCIANVLVIVKEYGWKVTLGVVFTVFPLAFGVGAALNLALNALHVSL